MSRKADAIDVSIFEPQTTLLVLNHPGTGEPVPSLWIEVVGPESQEYRTAVRKAARLNIGRKKLEDEIEEAEFTADINFGILAACVVGWNEEGFGAFDVDNVKATLKKYPSLTRQVDEFVAERKNFFRRS
jgi:hypothetical protein